MGKEARERKENRKTHLSQLAHEDPEKFETEWERKISSWISEINHSLGKEGKMQMRPVFHVVDEAIKILAECGEEAYAIYGEKTKKLLENLCCRHLSRHFGPELYRVSTIWKEIPTTSHAGRQCGKTKPRKNHLKG